GGCWARSLAKLPSRPPRSDIAEIQCSGVPSLVSHAEARETGAIAKNIVDADVATLNEQSAERLTRRHVYPLSGTTHRHLDRCRDSPETPSQ
ncbi:MAG TPA: hypothetical protein VF440_10655, partial [Novosphingobium sp.]